MRSFTLATLPITHWLVALLLGGAVLLASIPVAAGHDRTCHPPSGSGGSLFLDDYTITPGSIFGPGTEQGPILQLALNVHITDSGATVSGMLQINDGTSTTVLVAEHSHAAVTCDDANGDGVPELTMLEANLREALSGASASVRLMVQGSSGDDTGANGVYLVTVVVHRGDSSLTFTDVPARIAAVWEWRKQIESGPPAR